MTQQQTQIGSEAAGSGQQMGGSECADSALDALHFGLVPKRHAPGADACGHPERQRESDGGAVAGNGFAQSPQMAQSEPEVETAGAAFDFGNAIRHLKMGAAWRGADGTVRACGLYSCLERRMRFSILERLMRALWLSRRAPSFRISTCGP